MSLAGKSMQIPVAGAVLESGLALPEHARGAAAARAAAAERPQTVQAVVSRGGRPDLAGDYLRAVRQRGRVAPAFVNCWTFLIFGPC